MIYYNNPSCDSNSWRSRAAHGKPHGRTYFAFPALFFFQLSTYITADTKPRWNESLEASHEGHTSFWTRYNARHTISVSEWRTVRWFLYTSWRLWRRGEVKSWTPVYECTHDYESDPKILQGLELYLWPNRAVWSRWSRADTQRFPVLQNADHNTIGGNR